jgi:hypothetical protein
MGYPLTMDDLNAFDEEMKQANMNRELADSELAAVTGGEWIRWCTFIGHDYLI